MWEMSLFWKISFNGWTFEKLIDLLILVETLDTLLIGIKLIEVYE